MRRASVIAVLVGATALVALLLPAVASAGTYTWSMPADFTATGSGANPDPDNYGGAPWRYVRASSVALDSFSTNTRGGLAGWSAKADATTLVGVNPRSSSIVSGGDTFAPGEAVLAPSATNSVAIEWTAPASGAFSLTGAVHADDSGAPCFGIVWRLRVNGATKQSSGAINQNLSLTAHDKVDLVVSHNALNVSAACDVAGAMLQIQHKGTAPAPTLDSPADGSLISGGQPMFAGAAGTGFGASSQITVRVYVGGSASGTPVQTLHATRRTGGGYSVGVSSALADGQYTARAEQDDLASPPDVGTSPARTFRIKVHPPALTLTEPGSGASVRDQAPLFSGAAGDALGDSRRVSVVLYSGGSTRGKPIGTIHVARTGSSWSGRWPKALKLGRYTAKAMQGDDAGHTTVTPAHTFRIVKAPTVIGRTVTLSRNGHPTANVSIGCLAPAGQTCAGTVLIVTVGSYRPVTSGPSGQLRVLFAYVTVAGGRSLVVSRTVTGEVARVLRHSAPLKVGVSASLSTAGGSPAKYSAVRTLRLGS